MAITLYPFIIATAEEKENETLMFHEKIHLQQQKELLIIPFYIMYLSHSIYLLFRYMSLFRMYRLNIFEIEAYSNEMLPNYLKHRSWCQWANKTQITENYVKRMMSYQLTAKDRVLASILSFGIISIITGIILVSIFFGA